MLSKETFLEGIGYIVAWYVNFKLQLKDKSGEESFQYSIWYGAFKNFSNEDFVNVVRGYCNEEMYPPSSPTSLLNYANVKMLDFRKQEIENAWQTLLQEIQKNGFGIFYNSKNEVVNSLESALNRLENPLIKEVYEQNKSSFREINVENREWKRKEFFEIYETLLKRVVSEKVSQGQISTDKKLLK